jgi:hypothetical protein
VFSDIGLASVPAIGIGAQPSCFKDGGRGGPFYCFAFRFLQVSRRPNYLPDNLKYL